MNTGEARKKCHLFEISQEEKKGLWEKKGRDITKGVHFTNWLAGKASGGKEGGLGAAHANRPKVRSHHFSRVYSKGRKKTVGQKGGSFPGRQLRDGSARRSKKRKKE